MGRAVRDGGKVSGRYVTGTVMNDDDIFFGLEGETELVQLSFSLGDVCDFL